MQKWSTALLAVLSALALGLTALLPVGPSLAMAQQNCTATYVVRSGDTLYNISLSFPPVTWPEIAKANNITDPNRIFVGQSLCIPAAGTPAAATPTPAAATPTKPAATATPAGPAPTAAPTAVVTPVPVVVPVFSIKSVTRDTNVAIAGQNFPASATFTVRMGAYGSLGVNGTEAGTVKTNADGTVSGTFNIPAGLKGASLIAIRLEGPGGYHSYNWFWTFTASVP